MAQQSEHQQAAYKTSGGFFRPGKTQDAARRNGSTGKEDYNG